MPYLTKTTVAGVEYDLRDAEAHKKLASLEVLPADGSETADFNAATLKCQEIYDYFDALVAKYPRYITKETVGKDASNTHDWNRYTLCKRAFEAWYKTNYPRMYAWVNGSTTVYSVSVSPRVGDTVYSTTYLGTAYSTVTAVSNANQTRTINGKVFVRNRSADVEPTLVYTYTQYDARRPSMEYKYKRVWQKSGSTLAEVKGISSIVGNVLTDGNGQTYVRYPFGDLNSSLERPKAIVIGANEHGDPLNGDPYIPAIVCARLAKNICKSANLGSDFLTLLKNEYMVIFCPVINPWGMDKPSYLNYSSVNLDRNFDTPGWGSGSDTRHGAYGGSENETQYFMNTLADSKPIVATANHALGLHLNTSGEGQNAGTCCYMFGNANDQAGFSAELDEIGEVMASNYNLLLYDMGLAVPEEHGKTRSYIAYRGVPGGAVEMQARDGFVLDGQGELYTGRMMEASYTLLLKFHEMLLEKAANVAIYSVTNLLNSCTSNNITAYLAGGNSYAAVLSVASGYVLSSVKVMMGGADVTSTAYKNGAISISSVNGDIVITATATEKTAETYTITKNLTNCAISNSAATVEEGSAYSATITANSGYVLGSVTVTMGGSVVTVNDGVISIAKVTGNIVITATATEQPPAYTNLIGTFTADQIKTSGWADGYLNLNGRWSNSSAAYKSANGYVCFRIEAKTGDKLYFKAPNGATSSGVCSLLDYGNSRILSYKSDGTWNDTNDDKPANFYGSNIATDSNGVTCVTIYRPNTTFVRVILGLSSSAITASNLSGVIVTLNEEIT